MIRIRFDRAVTIILVATFLAHATQAIPITKVSNYSQVIRSQTCEIQSNGDLYGLGVRVGLYLQWLSAFILRNIGSWDTMSKVRTVNNALCIALALAAAISVVGRKALSIDYLLSYYLTVILFYSESYNLRLEVGETTPSVKHNGTRSPLSIQNISLGDIEALRSHLKYYTLAPELSLIVQNVFFAAYTLFGAWYWLRGIKEIEHSSCSEYAAIILLFHLDDNRWLKAATTFAIVLGIFWAAVFVTNLYMFFSTKGKNPGPIMTGAFRMVNSVCGFDEFGVMSLEPQPQGVDSRFKRPLWRNYFHYTWLYLMGPFVAIISVERIIASNRLTTSDIGGSTGQMIALVTGITSVLCALWELGIWLNEKGFSFVKFRARATKFRKNKAEEKKIRGGT